MRLQLEAVERKTGRRSAALDAHPLPAAAEHVWRWFSELNNARSFNGFGPNPLSYVDIAAWSLLTGQIVRPSEVRALKALDLLWLSRQRDDKPDPS